MNPSMQCSSRQQKCVQRLDCTRTSFKIKSLSAIRLLANLHLKLVLLVLRTKDKRSFTYVEFHAIFQAPLLHQSTSYCRRFVCSVLNTTIVCSILNTTIVCSTLNTTIVCNILNTTIDLQMNSNQGAFGTAKRFTSVINKDIER